MPYGCSTIACIGLFPKGRQGPAANPDLDPARACRHAQAEMTSIKPGPTLGKAGAGAREARRQRLAAALRENLRKRKAQARERDPPDSTSSVKSKQS